MSNAEVSDLQFTNAWFKKTAERNWNELIPALNPRRILEIGSNEGASTCYLIEKLADGNPLEIHCIDPWAQYDELPSTDMRLVEQRFDANIAAATAAAEGEIRVVKHKQCSDIGLAKLLVGGKRNYFDFIYVDGAHKASDVLHDAVAGFRLLRRGGVMAFDDYLWFETFSYGKNLMRCPKPAIDAFTTLYWDKLKIISMHLYQLYVIKTSD